MAKAVLLCGKICSGKSYYAEQLRQKLNAVVLSCDELTLQIFPPDVSHGFDDLSARARQYLWGLSLKIIAAGVDVIMDFGFWSKQVRTEVTAYYQAHDISVEWHYVEVSDEDWRRNIRERNEAVQAGKLQAYVVDDGLLAKLDSMFEPPSREEMDVWFLNTRWEKGE